MIQIEQLSKIYKTKQQQVYGSNDISLQFEDTGMIFILGKSGSGKKTLLNLIAGLDQQDSGSIHIDGTCVSEYEEKQWDELRKRDIGVIFQDYNLFEERTVYENLALRVSGYMEERIPLHIEHILHYLGLDEYKERKINQLSGGEKLRIQSTSSRYQWI